MFKSAVLKLTLYYLTIIMGLSLGFSFFLYHVSSNELDRGLRRPTVVDYGFEAPPNYNVFRQARIDEAQDNLRLNFIVFNLVILMVGGFTSYFLAKRTLDPIEVAMEAQGRFAADASHELRTPLTAMQTEIEVALRNKNVTKEQAKELLQSNLEEVIKLRGLSEALLQLAHQDDKGITLKSISVDQAATNAINNVVALAQAKDIGIDNKVRPAKVMADLNALTEVVTILLDNAVKYSPPKTTITIDGHSQGQHFVLTVADQGEGINPVDLPNIFDRFYRSDTSRHKDTPDGYGLGLSIAKQLVEQHGGTISATSTPKQGSTFSVKLPLNS